MKVISGLKELEILAHSFVYALLRLVPHKKHAPRDTFFRNREPNRIPEMRLGCQLRLPFRKI